MRTNSSIRPSRFCMSGTTRGSLTAVCILRACKVGDAASHHHIFSTRTIPKDYKHDIGAFSLCRGRQARTDLEKVARD